MGLNSSIPTQWILLVLLWQVLYGAVGSLCIEQFPAQPWCEPQPQGLCLAASTAPQGGFACRGGQKGLEEKPALHQQCARLNIALSPVRKPCCIMDEACNKPLLINREEGWPGRRTAPMGCRRARRG